MLFDISRLAWDDELLDGFGIPRQLLPEIRDTDGDFGSTDAGVIEHLKRYAEPPLAAALTGINAIADEHYDWRLNDAR